MFRGCWSQAVEQLVLGKRTSAINSFCGC